MAGLCLGDTDTGWFQALVPLFQWGIATTLIRNWLWHFPRAAGEGEMRSPRRGGEAGKKEAINTNWNRCSKGGTPHLEIF